MTSRFADTFYFLALLNPDDPAHMMAVEAAARLAGRLVTTTWILTEVGDAMASPQNRAAFLGLLDSLRTNPAAEVVPASEELFDAGVDLYARRPDKAWSLTDCISFLVMDRLGLAEALTGDRHFEQAGFRAVLRSSGP
jgi:predicted nucleic acid-binding protein